MNTVRPGFVVNDGRAAKARKIRTVLEQASGSDITGQRLLDVGTGSGEIAQLLGEYCEVVSVDPCDQRVQRRGYRYLRAGTTLPFADGSFDLAVSNHVIEHLDDAASHVRELARVLRPGGWAYLATPNRLWPWEVHYRVWCLHWLPEPAFERALRRMGRFTEPLHLLGRRRLLALCGGLFEVEDFAPRILRRPTAYHLHVSRPVSRLLGAMPQGLYRTFAGLTPTLIVALHRRH